LSEFNPILIPLPCYNFLLYIKEVSNHTISYYFVYKHLLQILWGKSFDVQFFAVYLPNYIGPENGCFTLLHKVLKAVKH